jgi:3'(2'), 5'-bisphosphate nucleotidase
MKEVLSQLLPQLIDLTKAIAKEILPIYEGKQTPAIIKADGSPLTQADLLANEMIKNFLNKVTPQIPIISEESCDIPFATRKAWPFYWLIDPIDGTKEFLAKNGDFTINIAFIDHHQPTLGIVSLPTHQTTYYALKGQGAWKSSAQGTQRLYTEKLNPKKAIRLVASRRHGENAAEKIRQHCPNVELMSRGSSLKFCLLAEGSADFYPRLGPTSEWDTAAAQCILEQAGGAVIDFSGRPLQYNTNDSYLNPNFLAIADTAINWSQFFSEENQ